MTALVHSWISGWSDWACPSILRPSTTTSAPSRSRAASITSTAPQKYVKLLSPVAKQATLCPLALMRSNCWNNASKSSCRIISSSPHAEQPKRIISHPSQRPGALASAALRRVVSCPASWIRRPRISARASVLPVVEP